MKKFKIAALGLAALVTGASAFTVKHATSGKFVQTYYVLATSHTSNGIVTTYQITKTGRLCNSSGSACGVHITTTGSTVITRTGTSPKTWLNKTQVVTESRKS